MADVTYDQIVERLCAITSTWNQHEDVRRQEQLEVKSLGVKLNALGGMDLMQRAYRAAHGQNKSASVLAAYWHGVGDWQW